MKFNRVSTVACLAASMLAGCAAETPTDGEMEWRSDEVGEISGTPDCDCPTCWDVSGQRLVIRIGDDDLHELDLDNSDAALSLGLPNGSSVQHVVPGSDFWLMHECLDQGKTIRRLAIQFGDMDLHPPPWTKGVEYPVGSLPAKERHWLAMMLRNTDQATVTVRDVTVHPTWDAGVIPFEAEDLEPYEADELEP